jgi:hypothetical protein
MDRSVQPGSSVRQPAKLVTGCEGATLTCGDLAS